MGERASKWGLRRINCKHLSLYLELDHEAQTYQYKVFISFDIDHFHWLSWSHLGDWCGFKFKFFQKKSNPLNHFTNVIYCDANWYCIVAQPKISHSTCKWIPAPWVCCVKALKPDPCCFLLTRRDSRRHCPCCWSPVRRHTLSAVVCSLVTCPATSQRSSSRSCSQSMESPARSSSTKAKALVSSGW